MIFFISFLRLECQMVNKSKMRKISNAYCIMSELAQSDRRFAKVHIYSVKAISNCLQNFITLDLVAVEMFSLKRVLSDKITSTLLVRTGSQVLIHTRSPSLANLTFLDFMTYSNYCRTVIFTRPDKW